MVIMIYSLSYSMIHIIAFPENQAKKIISSDSEFFTEPESLFGLG